MEYITLNNGAKMPVLGFGTWNLRGKECEKCVRYAIETGYELIDTAQMYGNEREVGNAIRQSGIEREKIFITTKVCRPNNSYHGTKKQIERALNELQLDYIDLFLIHEPYAESQEMYQAMKETCEDGKIVSLGVSNFHEDFFEKFIKQCGLVPAVNQVEAHIFWNRKRLQNLVEKSGTCMEAWSPFAAGKGDIFGNKVLKGIGKKYGKSAAQVALKYLVQRGIAVIPKSSNTDRIKENSHIFDFRLSKEDIILIERLDKGKSLFGWY